MDGYGVEGEWPVSKDHRILWGECDPYGHANHTTYLRFCEDLRCSHWLALGGSFAPDRFGPVLAQLEAKYLKPLVYDDPVRITMRPASFRRSSWVEEYAVWKEGLCFTCRSVLVAVRGSTGERVPLPEEIRAQLRREGAKEEG
jgi:acyl-CoA thioester hydrolase